MTRAAEQVGIRRIVVTLDASESGRPALETAVRLAVVLGAELEGIFVEDINLIRVAELPFLREVRSSSLAEEALSSQRMQRELHALARQAEQMLEQAAGETGVSWSFRVWRGRTEAESLITSFDADVLSLARVSSLVSYMVRSKHKPRRQPLFYSATSIGVLFSGSESAAKALAAACHLAKDLDALITVWLPRLETEDPTDLQQKAAVVLDTYAQRARFVPLTDSGVPTLVRAVNASRSMALIAEAGHPLLQSTGLRQCLQELSCPLLIVR